MEEARSELAFSRFKQSAWQGFVNTADQIRRRLTAMAEDSSLFVHASVEPGLVPSLPTLAERTVRSLASVADAVRYPGMALESCDLDGAVRDLDADLARLRESRATAPFALDRMLPFWALVFNLKEVAQDLNQMESILPQLV
jgi:hypothetical protein